MNKELYENIYKKNFSFGYNWNDFLKTIKQENLDEAKRSLRVFTGLNDFEGKTFLDFGCGSGIFSLAAKQMGAKRLVSVDIDTWSLDCVQSLKDKFYKDDESWEIKHGSILDEDFVSSLGIYDIVYSWGVIHHSGDMWLGLRNILIPCRKGGLLYLAIYNEKTGLLSSAFWKKLKRLYSKSNLFIRKIIEFLYIVLFIIKFIIQLINPIKHITNYKSKRGMRWWSDVIDWLGGHPYEYAKTSKIIDYFENLGYSVENVHDCKNARGCNEYLFRKK